MTYCDRSIDYLEHCECTHDTVSLRHTIEIAVILIEAVKNRGQNKSCIDSEKAQLLRPESETFHGKTTHVAILIKN